MGSLVIDMAGVVQDSIVDGPGIRVALFAQGCPHDCPGCHNPQAHGFGAGSRCTVDELYHIVKKNPLARGVTFSGGEPFAQAEGFAALSRRLRDEGYELASYSGYTFQELQRGTPAQRELLSLLDVLVDGRFLEARRNLDLRWRGSENQRILDVPASLERGEAVLSQDQRWSMA